MPVAQFPISNCSVGNLKKLATFFQNLLEWRICTSLISGFMAKESVVSTMEILFAGEVTSLLTPLAAATMMVFSLLYTPCVAAIASIRQELGGKWAVCVVLEQCAIAWAAAGIVRLLGMLAALFIGIS